MVLDMLRPVKLDDQAVRKANEIDNVRADGGLPAKSDSQLAGSQEMPQALFGVGGLVAKVSGEIALLLIAVHEKPLPNPPRKGEGIGQGQLARKARTERRNAILVYFPPVGETSSPFVFGSLRRAPPLTFLPAPPRQLR
ncbi:MAG TPA: hypothetical protein VJ809_14120 [Pirellulales bacterium]|nr:hypothetical protein [Pirellulales bacterium]